MSSNTKLVDLNLSANKIQKIDVRQLVVLDILDLSGNLITEIDLSASYKLKTLKICSNRLKKVNFGYVQSILEMNVEDNLIADLEQFKSLIYLNKLNFARN